MTQLLTATLILLFLSALTVGPCIHAALRLRLQDLAGKKSAAADAGQYWAGL